MKTKLFISLFSSIICLCLLFSILTVCAQNDFTITVGTLDENLNVNAGDEIVVPVYLSGNVGVYSYALKYTFDPSILELQDDMMKQNGKGDYKCLINDFTINNQASSVIIVSLAGGSSDVTKNGVITYLFFKVKQTAKSGFCNISVEYKDGNVCNWAAKPLYPAKVNGGVYVHSNNSDSDILSGTQGTSSYQTSSVSTSSRPIGYVPPDTVPDTASDYYSNASSNPVEHTSSDTVPDTKSDYSGSAAENTQSSTNQSSSAVLSSGEIEVENGVISRNTLIAIIIAGIAVIAGAVVSFIYSNKK